MLVLEHGVRRAVGDDRSLLQHDQPVDHLGQGGDDVFDPDHRDAIGVAHLADMVDEAPHLGRGQSGRDLVDQQQPRPAGQRAGEFDGLALLQGQAVGAFGELVAKPGEGGETRALRPALAGRPRRFSARNISGMATFSSTVKSPNGRGI